MITLFQSFTKKQSQLYDRTAMDLGVPGPLLMENAAGRATQLLLRLGVHDRVAVVCGKGNNGGDGFVLARHLAEVGVPCRVEMLVSPDQLAGDAKLAFDSLAGTGIAIDDATEGLLSRLYRCQWIVDGLLGTGVSGSIREPFATAIGQINQARRQVLALDVPSGLDADTGEPLGEVVRADHTATFVARKKGFDHPDSEAFTGKVHVISLGVDTNAVLQNMGLKNTRVDINAGEGIEI